MSLATPTWQRKFSSYLAGTLINYAERNNLLIAYVSHRPINSKPVLHPQNDFAMQWTISVKNLQ